MATDDKIIQSIELQGGKEVEKQLEDIGKSGEKSFADLGRAADKADLQKVANEADAAAKGLVETSAAAKDASENLERVGSGGASASTGLAATAQSAQEATNSIRNWVIGIAAATAGAVALGLSLLSAAKDAAAAAAAIGDAAEAAGIAVDKFQQLRFMLTQIGLSAGEADAAIKKMGEETDSKLTAAGKAVLGLKNAMAGVSFAKNAGGFDAWRQSVAQAALQAAKGAIDIKKLREILDTFKGDTSKEGVNQFANAVGELAKIGKGATEQMVGGAKIITVIGTTADKSAGTVDGLTQSITKLQEGFTTDKLLKFGQELLRIGDEEKRLEAATKVLGETLGRDFISALKSGDVTGHAFNRVLSFVQKSLQDTGLSAGQAVGKLQEFANSFVNLKDNAPTFVKTTGAIDATTKATQALTAATKEVSGEGFDIDKVQGFAKALGGVKDEVVQLEAAEEVFGSGAGQALIDALKAGTTDSEAFKTVLKALREEVELDAEDLKKFTDIFPEMARGFNQAAASSSTLEQTTKRTTTALADARVAAERLQKSRSPENLVAFGAALLKVEDASKRLSIAQAALGDTGGRALVRELGKSDSALRNQIARFNELRLGVTAADVAISRDLNRALKEYEQVSAQGRVEQARMFSPAFTQLIHAYNTAVRGSKGEIEKFAKGVRDTAIPILKDFLALFQKAGDAEIDPADPNEQKFNKASEGMQKFRDSVIAVGTAIKDFFFNIIVPGVTAIAGAIGAGLKVLNEFFGTSLNLADVGIVAVVTYLLGALPALAIAIGALFSDKPSAGLEKFKEGLKGLGVDVEQIKAVFTGASNTLKLFGVDFTGVVTTIKQLWADFILTITGQGDKVSEQNKWLMEFVAALKELGKEIPLTIVALTGLVTWVTKTFGAKRVLSFVILHLSGVMSALKDGVQILAFAITGLVGVVLIADKVLAATAFGQFARILIGIGIAVGVVLYNLENLVALASKVAAAINSMFGTNLTGADVVAGAIGLVIAALVLLIARTRAAALAVGVLSGALTFLARHPIILALGLIATAMLLLSNNGELAKDLLKALGVEATTADAAVDKFNKVLKNTGSVLQEVEKWLKPANDAFERMIVEILKSVVGLESWVSLWREIVSLLKQASEWLDKVVPKMQPRKEGEPPPTTSGVPGDQPVSPLFNDPSGELDPKWDQMRKSKNIEDRRGQKPPVDVAAMQVAIDVARTLQEVLISVAAVVKDVKEAFEELGGGVTHIALILETINAVLNGIGTTATTVTAAILAAFANLGTGIQGVTAGIQALTDATFQSINAGVAAAAAAVEAAIAAIIARLEAAVAQAQALAAAAASAGGSGGSGSSGSEPNVFAGGGLFRGRPGRDNNIVRVSDNEYMIQPKATRYWGTDVLNAINSMRMPKFDVGGLVNGFTALSPAISGSARVPPGGVSGRMAVDLDFGGGAVFQVQTQPNVATALSDYAKIKRQRQAGKRPRSGG